MVAVDIMGMVEVLFETLNTWDTDNEAVLQKVWFGALGVIACFKLPLHKDSIYVDGNGGCWAAPRLPPDTAYQGSRRDCSARSSSKSSYPTSESWSGLPRADSLPQSSRRS
jgi:hypothetical protein